MSNDPTSHHDPSQGELAIDAIVDEFVEQALADGRPDIDGACARFPEFAERIRQAAAALRLLVDQHSKLDGEIDSKSLWDELAYELGRGPNREIAPTLDSKNEVIHSLEIFGDKYRLREKLGEGGFGVVYVAEQLKPVRRKVAIKVVKPGMDSKEVLARFDAERQALAMMDHPNVAQVLDGGMTEDGRPYFVMELIRGIPITKFCDLQQTPMETRLEIFRDTCLAVQHAHLKGIIHRDIKPSNVLVTMRDDVPVAKVIDFGVAKALHTQLTDATVYTAFGQMIGTPLYMSPEQIQLSEQDVDTRSDIYSLGVLLYELITGDTPFTRQALVDNGIQHFRDLVCDTEPPRPSRRLSTMRVSDGATFVDERRYENRELKRISGELDWIVMKALEKNRARRYQSSAEFAKEIDRYLAGEPVEACPPTLGYRVSKFARQNRAILTIATLILGLLSLGIATTGWQAYRASKAEALALAESNRKSDALLELDQALTKSKSETQEKERALEAESRLRRRSEALSTFLTEVFEAPSTEQQPGNMKAVDLLNKSRDILLANNELEDLEKASMLSALAESYKNLTLFEDSLRCTELEIKHLENGNASEVEMAEAEMQHGITMSLAGRNKENARQEVRNALRVFEEQLGPNHEKTLLAKMQLSRMLTAAEIYIEAKRLADEVLRLADPKSDVFIYSTFCLARIARQRLNSERCLELCDQLLENPNLGVGLRINTLDERVQALSESGRRIEALEEAIDLKELTLREFGESHIYSNILCTLGLIQWRSEDPASAVATFSEAFVLRSELLGSTHNQTLDAQMLQGLALRRIGKYREAAAIFKQNLEGWWKHIDETGERYSKAVSAADVVVESLPYGESRQLLQSTRDKINDAGGGESLEAHRIQLSLAQLIWNHEDYEESKPYFENCFQKAVDVGVIERRQECCRICIVKLLEKDPDKALPWAYRLAEAHGELNARDSAWKRVDKLLVRGVFRLTGEKMEQVADCFLIDASRKSPVFTTVGNPYPAADALKKAGLLSEAIEAYSDCALFTSSFESVRIPSEISRAQLLVVSNQPAKAMNVINDLQKDLSGESAGLADRYSYQVSLLKGYALSDLGRFREAIASIEPDENKMLLARKAFILLNQGVASELRDFVDNEFAPLIPADDALFTEIIPLFRGAAILQEGNALDHQRTEQAISHFSGSKILHEIWWHAFAESLLGKQAILDQDVESAIVHLEKAAELWCSKRVRLIRPNFFPTSVPRESMLLLIKTLRSDGRNGRAAHWETVLAAYHDSPVEHLVKPNTPQTATTVHGP